MIGGVKIVMGYGQAKNQAHANKNRIGSSSLKGLNYFLNMVDDSKKSIRQHYINMI